MPPPIRCRRRLARLARAASACAWLLTQAAGAGAVGGDGPLDEALRRKLDENFRLCLRKQKGPYTQNYCVCRDGRKKPVMLPDGRIVSPCGGNPQFCAAFRERWALALAEEGVYLANLFARDLYQWDAFPDPHDLVRGYILEKFFIDTHPEHKLAQMRAYGGLAGAEYEARDAPRFFERYLALESFREPRHYLLAYELQRRFYVRADQGQIQKVRNLATNIQSRRSDFKPLRDAVHNQISAALLPRLRAYRDRQPAGGVRDAVEELIRELAKLTSLDESALRAQLAQLEDAELRSGIEERLPAAGADPVEALGGLSRVMVFARRGVEARQASPADRRRLVDLAITAAALVQRRGSEWLDSGTSLSARRHVELLTALSDAAYGAGLLMEREREAAAANLAGLLEAPELSRRELARRLAIAGRVVEWSQRTTLYAFEEVRPAWLYLMPDTVGLPDDVLRSSPLLVYAQLLGRLEAWAEGDGVEHHEIFGAATAADVRALNPGVALGPLRVAPEAGSYSRQEVIALPETPADLEPAAGILTRGEGNVVSHVQLLARSLGIPNAVLGASVYQQLAAHDGERVFYLVTPGGRVLVKRASAMDDRDRGVVAEYTRNHERAQAGALAAGAAKLHIDVERLDLDETRAIDLASLRRQDSGIRVGPKAAYLGELRHHFPDKVARGVVVPFGAYHAHYRRAAVALPASLRGADWAREGDPLPAFVEATYARFFGELVPAGTPERELSEWIRPRLDVIRHSIERAPLEPALVASIRAQLERQGLLLEGDPEQTVGLFVRSDTNVEDLDDFNGAGLNLTIFNLRSTEDVLEGLKRVWASPFSYRSFSWRQTLIDQPLWVLPSVVILESVPSEKSGVLVTADVDGGDPAGMLVATSEGVGGAVDGTPAETLVWRPDGVELVTLFKSPWRRLLRRDGGSEIVASTGRERVLEPAELETLLATARTIRDEFEPSRDPTGKARPWDIEFGFAGGKLWLFQTRPFVGNESLRNLPALASYDRARPADSELVSLEETLR